MTVPIQAVIRPYVDLPSEAAPFSLSLSLTPLLSSFPLRGGPSAALSLTTRLYFSAKSAVVFLYISLTDLQMLCRVDL